MSAAYGNLIEQILALISDGPMTAAELSSSMGVPVTVVGSVVSRLSRPTPGHRRPQRVHVVCHVYDFGVAKRYPRAQYALGPGENVKRPKVDKAGNTRRFRAKRKNFVNSVWGLAIPRKDRVSLMVRAKRVDAQLATDSQCAQDSRLTLEAA